VLLTDLESVASTPGEHERRANRLGWIGIAAVAAVVAVSWLRFLNAPFGQNHFGRVGARYALHVRNMFEDGLFDSSWSANWKPYAQSPYAHHPPLLNVLDAAVSVLPGEDPYQVMLAPHLLALIAIPAAAALLRGLGIGWIPTLLSVGAMTATGYYLVHSPIMFDIGTMLLFAAAVVHLRRHPAPSPRLVAAGCAAAVLATLGSWPGIVVGCVLAAWLYVSRHGDRTAIAVAVATAAGTATSLLFMFGVHGWEALADQFETRTGAASATRASDVEFGFGEFLERQWDYLNALLPVWYLAILPVALVVGVLDRRTRLLTLMSAVVAAGWVGVLRNGSFLHDYWAYLVLIPGLLGMAALADRVASLLRVHNSRIGPALAIVAALVIAASLGTKAFGAFSRDLRDRPADAGRLASAVRPADGQRVAWHLGADGARWLAYYWDRPIALLEGDDLMAAAEPDELVFVDLGNRPAWLPLEAAEQAVAARGLYAIFDVATLRDIASPEI
jgi:hypothetical protein